MNNRNQHQDERTPKEKAIEIAPAILGVIFLVLGMYLKNETLKMVFYILAAAVCIVAYIFVLIKEIIRRRKNKKGE